MGAWLTIVRLSCLCYQSALYVLTLYAYRFAVGFYFPPYSCVLPWIAYFIHFCIGTTCMRREHWREKTTAPHTSTRAQHSWKKTNTQHENSCARFYSYVRGTYIVLSLHINIKNVTPFHKCFPFATLSLSSHWVCDWITNVFFSINSLESSDSYALAHRQ